LTPAEYLYPHRLITRLFSLYAIDVNPQIIQFLGCLKYTAYITACPELRFDAIFMSSRKLAAFAFLAFHPNKAEPFNA
jgi:hypothetical protein